MGPQEASADSGGNTPKNTGIRNLRPPWRPGESGNLAGRPRGTRDFAELIAQETRGGAELVEYALKVLRSPKSKAAGKQWAVEYLTDRMLGRTPQATDEKRNAFAFFQAISPEQVALAERLV